MMKRALLIALVGTALSSPVLAQECGEPPLKGPSIPNGATADADDMRIARDGLLGFSKKVDSYLACMDQQGGKLLPYMTKEQQTRWDEDLNSVHNNRRDLQVKFNETIRAYRRAQQG